MALLKKGCSVLLCRCLFRRVGAGGARGGELQGEVVLPPKNAQCGRSSAAPGGTAAVRPAWDGRESDPGGVLTMWAGGCSPPPFHTASSRSLSLRLHLPNNGGQQEVIPPPAGITQCQPLGSQASSMVRTSLGISCSFAGAVTP